MRLPGLGVGIVYVPGLEPLLEPGNTCVQVLEIEPQTLWRLTADPRHPYLFPPQSLQVLRRFPQTKIIHSVNFAVGGTQLPTPEFSAALVETARAVDAAWISEHLSVTHVRSNDRTFHTGFMLPPLQTEEGARRAAQTIAALAMQLPVPFAVETAVNYLRPRKGELTDGQFVAMAVEQADCGILLDLHNIWTNERNGRQGVKEFLAEIPLDRVWEIHVGGGFELEGYWLDAHSGAVPEPVLEILEDLLPALPNVGALVYEIFPSFIPHFGLDGVDRQLRRLRDMWDRCARRPRHDVMPEQPAGPAHVNRNDTRSGITPELWEGTLGELVTNGAVQGVLAEELGRDPGVPLVRNLIWKFRAGAIVKVLGALTKLVLLHSGQQRLEELMNGYFAQSKPEPFASQEARGFIHYLRGLSLDIPYLPEILGYEEAAIEALLTQRTQCLPFPFDPMRLLQALVEGKLPERLEPGMYELEIPPEAA